MEVDPTPAPVIWPKSSIVSKQEFGGINNEVKGMDKFNINKVDINFLPPTHFQVLRAYKNYDSNRLILFAKILAGEITPFSNQSYILTGAFDKFYRFDSIEIGGKKCEKVIKGELASLSFMDISTYPFFIKRALGG